MRRAAKAGAAYFGAVFLVAFMFGIFRVLVLVPRLGAVTAVLLETPLILAVSWFASRWISMRLGVAQNLASRAVMGGAAFVLLMIVELGVSTLVFGTPVGDYFAAIFLPPGLIGLAGQIGFAFIPLIQRGRR